MVKIRLDKFICSNLAPFEQDLSLNFDENDIVMLSAVNGKGKTTIISYIVDAFYEIAKNDFHNEFENKQNYLYRISSSLYVLDKSKIALVYIRFKVDEKNLDYVYIANKVPNQKEEYNRLVEIDGKIEYEVLERQLENNIFAKRIWYDGADIKSKLVKQLFYNNILTYFPSYRGELPSWLNDVYKTNQVEFTKDSGFSGFLPNSIEVRTDTNKLTNWMLDFILDELATKAGLYSKNSKDDKLLSFMNRFMRVLLHEKGFGDSTSLSINKRHDAYTRIAVADSKNNKSYPNFYNMSSGEIAIMGIFVEILKQVDKLYTNIVGDRITEATGIVVIDEIDKHLHMRLQQDVVPFMMNMFPNIQFMITSHSPFVGMGLYNNDECKKRSKIIDLDNGGIITKLENTNLYNEVYNTIIAENDKFKQEYERVLSEIKESNKNIVVTEGKTDVLHLKTAMKKLNLDGLSIHFMDTENDFGEKRLKTFLENISKIKQNNKIIGIFDRDVAQTVAEIESDDQEYKRYGNNVFAFCIPKLQEGGDKISIEHYYGNKIKEYFNERRLFTGSEFSNKTKTAGHMFKDNTGQFITSNITDEKINNDTVIDNEVYSIDNLDVNVALSKSAFANNIETIMTDFDWEVFRPIFECIKKVIDE